MQCVFPSHHGSYLNSHCRLDIKSTLQVSAEGKIYSASIHPDVNEKCFVAGGEDFKLYKYSTEEGKTIG